MTAIMVVVVLCVAVSAFCSGQVLACKRGKCFECAWRSRHRNGR